MALCKHCCRIRSQPYINTFLCVAFQSLGSYSLGGTVAAWSTAQTESICDARLVLKNAGGLPVVFIWHEGAITARHDLWGRAEYHPLQTPICVAARWCLPSP